MSGVVVGCRASFLRRRPRLTPALCSLARSRTSNDVICRAERSARSPARRNVMEKKNGSGKRTVMDLPTRKGQEVKGGVNGTGFEPYKHSKYARTAAPQ